MHPFRHVFQHSCRQGDVAPKQNLTVGLFSQNDRHILSRNSFSQSTVEVRQPQRPTFREGGTIFVPSGLRGTQVTGPLCESSASLWTLQNCCVTLQKFSDLRFDKNQHLKANKCNHTAENRGWIGSDYFEVFKSWPSSRVATKKIIVNLPLWPRGSVAATPKKTLTQPNPNPCNS